MSDCLIFDLPSEAHTAAFADQLARAVAAALPRGNGVSIALDGNLGAGKTTLVRYLLRALGIAGRIKSPSYAIVEPYDTAAFPIWHFDFYRLSAAEEFEDAGFRDIFASHGLRLVEWPQQLPVGVVPYDLRLQLSLGAADARCLQVISGSAAGLQLLRNLEHERPPHPTP